MTRIDKACYERGCACYDDRVDDDAVEVILAQPEQEPVAFYVYKPTLPRGHLGKVSDGDLPWVYDQDPSSGYSARMLVYTTPPQRKPLSDEQVNLFINGRGDEDDEDYVEPTGDGFGLTDADLMRLVRRVEAAHDIKE